MVAPATSNQGKPPAVPGVTDPKLLGLLAAAGVGASQVSDGADPPVVDERSSPKEVELTIGGVKKRVSIAELERIYGEGDKVAAAKKAVDDRFAELGNLSRLQALDERLQGLDDSRRRAVFNLLQGAPVEAEDDDEQGSTADDAEAAAFGDRSRSRAPAASGVSREEFDELMQVVKGLCSFENARIGEQRKASTSDRVDAAMKQFPVFSEETNPAVLAFAKRSIMGEIAGSRDPNAVEAVVQQAAAALQGFKKKSQDEALEGTPVPRQTVAAPKGGWKGRHLQDGSLRKAAERALAGRG